MVAQPRRPKVAPPRTRRKTDPVETEDANAVLTRQMLRELGTTVPEVSAGFTYNVEQELAGVQWPGKDQRNAAAAAEADTRMMDFVRKMGERAPAGMAAKWRNWARSFAIIILTALDFKDEGEPVPFPAGLMENDITTTAAELRTIFTTPGPTVAPTEAVDATASEQLAKLISLQYDTMSAIGDIAGRVTRLEKQPAPTDQSGPLARSGTDGVSDLERRLAGFRSAVEADAPSKDPSKMKIFNVESGASRNATAGGGVISASTNSGVADNEKLSLMYRRMEYLSRSPVDAIMAQGSELKEFEDWPFAGTAGADRVAPWYFPQVYRGDRRGTEYARTWIEAHGLRKNHMAQQMVMLLMAVDEALPYDRINILNSASFEIIARRCYALEKVFEKCKTEQDWKDPKNGKARMHLFDEFDLAAIMASGVRVPTADQTVKKEMEVRTQFDKYSKKAEEAAGGN